jgi:copper chaperone
MQQRFEVQGMSCGHCVRAVTQALQRLDPQARVQVDLAHGRVEVESEQPREALARAIRDEGYAVAA